MNEVDKSSGQFNLDKSRRIIDEESNLQDKVIASAQHDMRGQGASREVLAVAEAAMLLPIRWLVESPGCLEEVVVMAMAALTLGHFTAPRYE